MVSGIADDEKSGITYVWQIRYGPRPDPVTFGTAHYALAHIHDLLMAMDSGIDSNSIVTVEKVGVMWERHAFDEGTQDS